MRKWADPDTERGRIEATLESIISGGARDEDINKVVSKFIEILREERKAGKR